MELLEKVVEVVGLISEVILFVVGVDVHTLVEQRVKMGFWLTKSGTHVEKAQNETFYLKFPITRWGDRT